MTKNKNKVVHAKSYTINHIELVFQTEMGYMSSNKIKNKICLKTISKKIMTTQPTMREFMYM